MTLFDRIKYLSKQRDKSLQEVAIELGFSENVFYYWKKASPSTDKLQKVADYFGVSTDYLLGRENVPEWASNEDVNELEKFLEESNMTYKNKVLTNAQKEKIKKMLEVLFWETGEELGKNEKNKTEDE